MPRLTAALVISGALALGISPGCGSSSQKPSGTGNSGGGGDTGGETGTGGRPGTGGTATGGRSGTGGAATGGSSGSGGSSADASASDSDAASATDASNVMITGATFCPAGSFALMLPANAKATLVKGGLRGAEGPVWVDSEKVLYFSEIHRTGADYTMASSTTISKVTGTTPTEWVAASGSNGLALVKVMDKWQILAATHDKEELSIFDLTTKARTTYVGQYMGKPFNSPNDLAVRSDGTVYFSDPDWQAAMRPGQGATRVYRVAPADKSITVVDDSLMQPNGVSLSPDEKFLYVTSIQAGGAGRITRYEVNADGTTKAGSLFKMTKGQYPDGMTFDCAGNLYVTSSMGVEVYSGPQDMGRVIAVGNNLGATNVAFGGMDHKTLYITSETDADKALYSLQLNVPGLPY